MCLIYVDFKNNAQPFMCYDGYLEDTARREVEGMMTTIGCAEALSVSAL